MRLFDTQFLLYSELAETFSDTKAQYRGHQLVNLSPVESPDGLYLLLAGLVPGGDGFGDLGTDLGDRPLKGKVRTLRSPLLHLLLRL